MQIDRINTVVKRREFKTEFQLVIDWFKNELFLLRLSVKVLTKTLDPKDLPIEDDPPSLVLTTELFVNH